MKNFSELINSQLDLNSIFKIRKNIKYIQQIIKWILDIYGIVRL